MRSATPRASARAYDIPAHCSGRAEGAEDVWGLGVVTGANSRARSCEMGFRTCSKLSFQNDLACGRSVLRMSFNRLAREFAPVTGGRRNPLKRLNSDKEMAIF